MQVVLNGRREKHGLVKVLFCWRQNIQKSIKSWVKPLPDGMMGEGRSPGSDWDEDTLVLTVCCFHRNWGASLNDFYWKKLWEIPGTKWADREMIEKQTSASWEKELSSN